MLVLWRGLTALLVLTACVPAANAFVPLSAVAPRHLPSIHRLACFSSRLPHIFCLRCQARQCVTVLSTHATHRIMSAGGAPRGERNATTEKRNNDKEKLDPEYRAERQMSRSLFFTRVVPAVARSAAHHDTPASSAQPTDVNGVSIESNPVSIESRGERAREDCARSRRWERACERADIFESEMGGGGAMSSTLQHRVCPCRLCQISGCMWRQHPKVLE